MEAARIREKPNHAHNDGALIVEMTVRQPPVEHLNVNILIFCTQTHVLSFVDVLLAHSPFELKQNQLSTFTFIPTQLTSDCYCFD